MRHIIHAILLVALLQLLWVVAESNGAESPGSWHIRTLKVFVGFPVRCASYSFVRTTGDMQPSANYTKWSDDWLPGFRASPVLVAIDAFAAVAAFVGFRWLLRFEVGRVVCAGFVMGLIAGVLDSFGTIASWRPVSVWIIAPLLIVGLPATVW